MSVEILVWDGETPPQVPDGTLVLADRESCLARYDEIQRAAGGEPIVRVLVRGDMRAIFESLARRPGVRIRNVAPRAELARLWGRVLPAALDDPAIVALGLADTALPSGADPVTFTLARAFGDTAGLFAKARLDTDDEIELVRQLIARSHPEPARPAVDALLRSRLRAWHRTGSVIAGALSQDPASASWFLVMALLRDYPSALREAVTREIGAHLGPLPLDLPSLDVRLGPEDLPAAVRLPLEAALRPYLCRLPLPAYLDIVSGWLRVELDVLVERATSGDAPDLDRIAARFSALGSQVIGPALAEIRHARQAARALVAVEAAQVRFRDFADVADFFTAEYLPAKHQFAGRSEVRERLIAWNESYGGWLVDNYPRLLVSRGTVAGPFAADRLHRLVHDLLAIGKLPILVVIDGLGWPVYERLQVAAQRGGFHLVDAQACLAPLPTITEIGMTSLVSGSSIAALAQASPDRGQWRRVREGWFARSFPGARFGRAGNRAQVADCLSIRAPSYVLHSLVVDRLVHDPDLTDELLGDWLASYFTSLWAAIGDASEAPHLAERIEEITVVVATDHGYTDLLRPEPIHSPPVLAYASVPIEAQATHRRAIEVRLPGGTEGEQIRARLAADWYVIEGERFGLPAEPSWLLPREQRTTSAPPARTHGGPSLEESIVPLATFGLERPTSADLRLAVHGRLIVQSATAVSLAVTNASTWTVRSLRLRATELGLDAMLDRVDGESTAHIPVSVLPQVSGSRRVAVRVAALGEPSRHLTLAAYVEPSEAERLLGDDRLSDFFGPEGM